MYSKTVEKAAQFKGEFCTRVTSLVSELRAEKDCIARFEKDRIHEHVDECKAVAPRQKALDALKDQFRGMELITRQVQEELTVATSELEALRSRAERVEGKLSIAQTDVPLQTTL